jgi:hypothetical protein
MFPFVAPALLTKVFSFSGQQLGLIVLGIVLFAAGFGSAWKIQGWRADAKRTAEAEARVVIKDKQTAVTHKEGARQTEVQTRIQTVYVDREREINSNEEAATEANLGCTVPQRTVRLWDSANQMRPADPASVADLNPSGVKLTDIERQHERETSLCHRWIERAKGWERWYAEQMKATNGTPSQ